jgi:hypothetical protein
MPSTRNNRRLREAYVGRLRQFPDALFSQTGPMHYFYVPDDLPMGHFNKGSYLIICDCIEDNGMIIYEGHI